MRRGGIRFERGTGTERGETAALRGHPVAEAFRVTRRFIAGPPEAAAISDLLHGRSAGASCSTDALAAGPGGGGDRPVVGSPAIPTASDLTRTAVRELIDGFAEPLLEGSSKNCCPMVYRSALHPALLAQPQPRGSGNASCLQQTRIRTVCAGCCCLTDGLGPNASYLHPPSLPVVCKGFSTPLRAARLLNRMPGAFRARRGSVIFDDLWAIQLRHGFLPKAELEGLSQRTQTPLYQIHSVASFYPHFHLAPPPKAEIRVCADMSCHLNGACELRVDLERCFANSRREDVQIRDVSCLGRCDHAPAISINDHIFTDVTAARAEQIARSAIHGEAVYERHPEQARIECTADPYGDRERSGVVRKLIPSKAWDDVLA